MKLRMQNRIQLAKKELWVASLAFLLLGLMSLYIYLLSASVVHVVIRQELQHSIKDLHSEIGILETKYIDAQHTLSASVAALEGYEKTQQKIFIDRTPGSLVLSE